MRKHGLFLVPAGSNIFLGLCTVFSGKNCGTLPRNGKVPLQDASKCKKEIPQNVHNLSSPIKAYLCFIAMHFSRCLPAVAEILSGLLPEDEYGRDRMVKLSRWRAEGAWSKSRLSCVVNDTFGGSNAVQVSIDPHLTRSLEHIPRH